MNSTHITYSIDDFSYFDRHRSELNTVKHPSHSEKDLVHQKEKNTAPKDSVELSSKTESSHQLSKEEQERLENLKKRDREVRQHEEAHRNAAGSLAGPPQYTYEQGPDGKSYVTGGHVNINTSEGRTPSETIQKAQILRRAALAPENPSAQDRKVAEQAQKMEQEARAKLQQENIEKLARLSLHTPKSDSSGSNDSSDTDSSGHELAPIDSHTQNHKESDKIQNTDQPPIVAIETPAIDTGHDLHQTFSIKNPPSRGQYLNFFA